VQRTVLSSEMAGNIVEFSLREGDRFRKGDQILGFDCSVYKAQLSHAIAQEGAAEAKVEVSGRLDKLNGISQLDLSDAKFQHQMAQAETARSRAMVQHCAIAAPFSGRVAQVRVQRYSFVPEGTALVDIYDDSAFELEMLVPSRWLVWLKPGYPFSVRVDETGREYRAEVIRLAAQVDPVSQTVKLFGRIVGGPGGLLPGMGGTVTMSPPPQTAAR
jgi:RND family efflux transporter MFP subunit